MAGDRLPRKVMDAKRLASLLRGGPGGPLVIDSRSFVEYNSWHVLSSVNICCSKLVKRRLQQGKVTIAELIQPAARSQVCSPPVSLAPPGARAGAAFPFSALEAALCSSGSDSKPLAGSAPVHLRTTRVLLPRVTLRRQTQHPPTSFLPSPQSH